MNTYNKRVHSLVIALLLLVVFGSHLNASTVSLCGGHECSTPATTRHDVTRTPRATRTHEPRETRTPRPTRDDMTDRCNALVNCDGIHVHMAHPAHAFSVTAESEGRQVASCNFGGGDEPQGYQCNWSGNPPSPGVGVSISVHYGPRTYHFSGSMPHDCNQPTETPTSSPSPTNTLTPTPTSSPTSTTSPSPSPSPTPTASPTPTRTPTASPSPTKPTPTGSPSPTPTSSLTPTETTLPPVDTPVPSPSPTPTATIPVVPAAECVAEALVSDGWNLVSELEEGEFPLFFHEMEGEEIVASWDVTSQWDELRYAINEHPSLSKDNCRQVFVSDGMLWFINPWGGNPRQWVDPRTGDPVRAQDPDWGRWFVSFTNLEEGGQIYLTTEAGWLTKPLLDEEGFPVVGTDTDWHPSGDVIAYVDPFYNIMFVEVGYTSDGYFYTEKLWSSGLVGDAPRFSADGSELSFTLPNGELETVALNGDVVLEAETLGYELSYNEQSGTKDAVFTFAGQLWLAEESEGVQKRLTGEVDITDSETVHFVSDWGSLPDLQKPSVEPDLPTGDPIGLRGWITENAVVPKIESVVVVAPVQPSAETVEELVEEVQESDEDIEAITSEETESNIEEDESVEFQVEPTTTSEVEAEVVQTTPQEVQTLQDSGSSATSLEGLVVALYALAGSIIFFGLCILISAIIAIFQWRKSTED